MPRGYPGGWVGPAASCATIATVSALLHAHLSSALVHPHLSPGLLHIHLHLSDKHRFHGPPVDYAGLAVAVGASWIGLPGPGEPVLIAAGVLAARHQLDLASVVLVAWLAATAGGIIGWAIGLKAGRALVTGPGPLRTMRIRAVERGAAIFARYPKTAILMTPAFVAGINGVRSAVYQPINIISAAAWAVILGVGSYLVGPVVLDVFDDIGTVASGVVITIVVLAAGLELARRRRRRAARG